MYAVLANGGTRAEPVAIERVASREGEPILGEPPALRAVVPPGYGLCPPTCWKECSTSGTASSARSAGFRRPAAGKTGTTNDYRDAWFVGFTSDLVAAVWVGFDQRSPLGMSGAPRRCRSGPRS